MTQPFRPFAFVALLLCPIGCSDAAKPKLFPVSGTVTLDGQPLADGQMYFKTEKAGVIDPITIKDGKFSAKVHEGERRVEIIVNRPKLQTIDGKEVEVQTNILPKRYNLESTLTATVTAGGPNQFTFELTSQ